MLAGFGRSQRKLPGSHGFVRAGIQFLPFRGRPLWVLTRSIYSNHRGARHQLPHKLSWKEPKGCSAGWREVRTLGPLNDSSVLSRFHTA